jgi:hypothetical protein
MLGEGGEVGVKLGGHAGEVSTGGKRVKVVGVRGEADAWGRSGDVRDVKVEKSGREARAMRHPHPNDSGIGEAVAEEGHGLPAVEVIGKPPDEGRRQADSSELSPPQPPPPSVGNSLRC